MCGQLDACHVRTFDYKSSSSDPWYLQVEGRVHAKVLGLWAFGSWARGASECGDLDLAARFDYAWAEPALRGGTHPIEVDSFLPDFDAIRRAMLGSRPHVHVLDLKRVLEHGKSADFAVDPESLVLIWRPELDGQLAHDWRASIEGVKPQAQETRAPRLTDALPLLIEQTAMDLRHAENAVRAHQGGLVAWEFRPHGATRREAVAPTAAEVRMLRELGSQCSDEALVLRTLVATRDVRKRYRARVTYWFGPCDIWATMLADLLTVRATRSSSRPSGASVDPMAPLSSPPAPATAPRRPRSLSTSTGSETRCGLAGSQSFALAGSARC
jgi:hypothetical protein